MRGEIRRPLPIRLGGLSAVYTLYYARTTVRSRDGIVSARIPRVTAADSLQGKPSTPCQAMALDREQSVVRAGRCESA